MNLDELKGGLSTLADELEPFEGNVRALHRHERRRRIVLSSIAAVVVVVFTVASVAISHSHDSGNVHVAGLTGKEVAAAKITHVDVLVIPATPSVKAALDASLLVGQYARVPHADRSFGTLTLSPPPLRTAMCALRTNDGYAVDAATPGVDIRAALTRLLAGAATVSAFFDPPGVDAEIFLRVGASSTTTAAAGMLAAVESDPDIQKVQFVSTSDAYEIFKHDFADQPALIESTKPSDLPASFRITMRPDRSIAVVVARYRHHAGVDTIITPPVSELFDPTAAFKGVTTPSSPCAKP